MILSNYPFTLDIQKTLSQVSIPLTLGETARQLFISLTDGGKPYIIADGCSAVLAGRKADGTAILHDCVIEKNTTIRYHFNEQTATAAGKMSCQILLFDEGGKYIASPRFTMVVYEDVAKADEVLSENDLLSFGRMLAAEEGRLAAEEDRNKAEAARAEAEQERAEAFYDVLSAIQHSGVYVGEGEMPAGYYVQVCPLGDAQGDIGERWILYINENGHIDLMSYSQAIADALEEAKASGEFGGGGGSGGADGFSPTIAVSTITGGHRLTITDKDGTKYVDIKDGVDGKDGANGADGKNGADGQRGTGILKVSTTPTSYTTSTAGVNPIKRMSLATIKSEAGVSEVLVGDCIAHSYYLYHIYYLDATYAYMDKSQSIRGATGATGADGKDGADGAPGADGKSAYAYAQEGGYTGTEAAFAANLAREVPETLSLGIASDGLIYLFVNGQPVGTGIPQSTGVEGDVFGYVDENNTIVLNGNLADGTYTLKYEMSNGDIVNIGNMVIDSTVYYTVTSNLTNCSISNSTKTVAQGESYSATITANDGYELKSVTVTMGGSAASVSGGVINIASVTGDIVIVAVAEESQNDSDYTNLATPDASASGETAWNSGGWCNDSYMAGSSYAYRAATDGKITTNTIAVAHGDTIYVKGITYTANTFPQLAVFNANGTYVKHGYVSLMQTSQGFIKDLTATEGGDYWSFKNAGSGNSDVGTRFIRISGMPSGSINDIIITRNEPINSDTPVESEPANFFVVGGDGYILNGRCSSTGADRFDAGGAIVSNYIDVQDGDTVYVKNAPVMSSTYSGMKLMDNTTIGLNINNSDYITDYSESEGVTQFTINKADAAAIRILLNINYSTGNTSVTDSDVIAKGVVINIKRNGEWL